MGILMVASSMARAEGSRQRDHTLWLRYDHTIEKMERQDRIDGISYIISGSLAVAGGLLGADTSNDALQRGIFIAFQSIGIASVGYGAYRWQIGDESRLMHDTLKLTPQLSDSQRMAILRSYYTRKKEVDRRVRIIRTITHGLIAGLNVYSATQQKNAGLKSALFFVGGINALAAVSFSFNF